MKYVILKIKIIEGVYKAFPYIFCGHDTHSVVAQSMKHMLMREMKKEAIVHSGGFIYPNGDDGGAFNCWRGSETLGIKKEDERCEEDERIINCIDSTAGVMYD